MPAKRPVAVFVAIAGLVGGILAGCTPSRPSTTEATPTISATPEIEPPASPTPSPTPSGRPFTLDEIPVPADPKYPAAMDNGDEEGARAFVSYILTELSYLYATGDAEYWSGVGLDDCTFCEWHTNTQKDSHRLITGRTFRIVGSDAYKHPTWTTAWVVYLETLTSSSTVWDLETMTTYKQPAEDTPEALYFVVGQSSEGKWYLADTSTERPSAAVGDVE